MKKKKKNSSHSFKRQSNSKILVKSMNVIKSFKFRAGSQAVLFEHW